MHIGVCEIYGDIYQLRNRNISAASVKLWKHKWKFWRMRNALGTQDTG